MNEYLEKKVVPFLTKNWDFLLVIILSLLFSLLRMFISNLFISVLGFIILLIFPGYCLSFLIFSKKDDLKIFERIGITLISSIILSSVLGFILVYLDNFNLQLVNWLLFTADFLLALVGILFRVFITDSFSFNPFRKDLFRKIIQYWKKESTLTKALSIIAIFTVLGAFVSFVFILQYQPTLPGTTVFSVVDTYGNRLSNVRTGENQTIAFTVKVNNSNLLAIDYQFEAWVTNKSKADLLNNSLENVNMTLLQEVDFSLNSFDEYMFTFNFSLSKIGDWTTYFILWENEKPDLDQTNQEQFLLSIIETRIKAALQPNAEKKIYGLNVPVFVLTDKVEDTGDIYDVESWTMSSQGWNWTAVATNTTLIGGYRADGYLYMQSNVTSSYLALRSSTRNEIIFNSSAHLYAESRIAPISDVSNYHSFGISLDISDGSPNWYRARLTSNTTHLIIGVGSFYTANCTNYTKPTVLPFDWSIGTFHTLRIDIDYENHWIAYQCDGIILRNTTLDEDYVLKNYNAVISVENDMNCTNSAIKMDYYNYGWTKEDTPFDSIKNYLKDTGGQFNEYWLTSSEGWDWLPTLGNETNFGIRMDDYIEFYSPYNNTFQGISTPLNDVNYVRSTEQLIVSTNMTYLENSTVYKSFGLAVDLFKDDLVRFIAIIISNSTHLKVGMASNYSINAIFYTETIIPFSWIRNDYHLLEIKIDYANRSIAFYADDILIRNSIQDFGYIDYLYNATIFVENDVNFTNASLRIEDFMAKWINWNNLTYPSYSLVFSQNQMQEINEWNSDLEGLISDYIIIEQFRILIEKRIIT
ncbi:MAG: DUF1616 domain-containing protein, partial [Asgard group archaeon]|nr:DUF1616 domain-containing protein [Asgard group archaeon]